MEKERQDEQGELLKGNTPTLILAVLDEAPRHGYAIAREIERRSRDAFRLGEGSLYPTLRALEARHGRLSLATYHGLYENKPLLATCFLLTGMAVAQLMSIQKLEVY